MDQTLIARSSETGRYVRVYLISREILIRDAGKSVALTRTVQTTRPALITNASILALWEQFVVLTHTARCLIIHRTASVMKIILEIHSLDVHQNVSIIFCL